MMQKWQKTKVWTRLERAVVFFLSYGKGDTFIQELEQPNNMDNSASCILEWICDLP